MPSLATAAQVRGLREHPVVAHGLRGQFAGVLERDFDFGAVGGDGNFLLVELHLVGAGDFHLADLVGGERAAGGEQPATGRQSMRIVFMVELR